MRKATTATVFTTLFIVSVLFGAFASTPAAAADNKNYPVLLIHGLASNPQSWKNLPTYLENRGYDVFVMDFNEWSDLPFAGRQLKDYHYLAALISRQIAEIKAATGQDKVDIIAHSIAGLAVRAYIGGLGERIETRGRYSGDVNRVIYLATPFFGVEKLDKNFKQMLKDTDWGVFLDVNEIFNTLRYASPELIEIQDAFTASRAAQDVEELTICSEQDYLIKPFSTNLDGTRVNSFYVPRSTVRNPTLDNSHHLSVKQFAHAYHDLLGRPSKTLLGVGSKDHAVLLASTSFFAGTTSWQKLNVNINGDNDTLVILRIAPGSGINLNDFKPAALELKRVGQKSRRVKMDWQSKTEVYYFTQSSGGTFELTYNPIDYFSFRFDLTLYKGLTQFADFDLKNPPFDPEYQPQPGDETIVPGRIPGAVTDYASLRRFVLAAFPLESRIYKAARDITPLVKRVRNALVATYPGLLQKNDIDKFGLSEDEYVDFVKDASSAGILANKLDWAYTKIEKPEKPGGGGGGGGGGDYPETPPSEVHDYDSLREFVLWFLKDEAYAYASNNKPVAARIRDALAERYSTIVRVNEMGTLGWVDITGAPITYTTSNDGSHTDAFVYIPAHRIIDFVSGAEDPGVILDKLRWGPTNICPGGQLLP